MRRRFAGFVPMFSPDPLARAIAEQHGGTLTLRNRPGSGGKVAGLLAELRLPID